MFKYLALTITATLAMLLSFTVVAHAAAIVDPMDGSTDLWGTIYAALNGGHYALAASAALIVAVALLRKYAGGRWPWMHTDAGSASLVLAGSLGTALFGSLAGGGPMTWHLLYASLLVAFTAAGGYTALKKIALPPLMRILPAWAGKWASWLFVHTTDAPVPVPVPAPNALKGN